MLLEPPPVNVTEPIYTLLDLENKLASGSGTQYLAGLRSLSAQHQTMFYSGNEPCAANGVLAVLADGGWLDYIQNEHVHDTTVVNNINQLAYEWIVSKTLQLNGVFLHAVVSPSCTNKGRYSMPGEGCVTYEDVTFDVFPATWTYSTAGGSAASLVQYTAGDRLFDTIIDGQYLAVTARNLLVRSLQCQMEQRTTATMCHASYVLCLR